MHKIGTVHFLQKPSLGLQIKKKNADKRNGVGYWRENERQITHAKAPILQLELTEVCGLVFKSRVI